MKSLDDLVIRLNKWQKNINNNVMEKQHETAEIIKSDIISYAPHKSGEYINSIDVDETNIKGNIITTIIGSDLLVGPTIWGNFEGIGNNPAGTYYNLGYLLEHGTLEHAIPNAWNKGFYYGFTDAKGKFHKGTLDRNWHPGTVAIPHYSLALIKNKKLYKDNIKLAWRMK